MRRSVTSSKDNEIDLDLDDEYKLMSANDQEEVGKDQGNDRQDRRTKITMASITRRSGKMTDDQHKKGLRYNEQLKMT